ncbi:unnamed protein product [Pipistrellus nathusii]|uniref:Protein FRG2-like-2 n=1 Tax=Pipistrellus nathusii TaxID=59473 RepID=A0ABN9ZDR4_PIPNA
MDSGMENQDPHSSPTQSPTEQPPFQSNSLQERSSDVEEKPLEEKAKTSSRFVETSTHRGEAGSCSSQESSRKRKRGSRESPCDGAEPSLEKRRKNPDAGHSSCSQEPGDTHPSRAQRKSPGHRKQPRSRPRGVQPPLLRKSLVTSLRTMSEAICHTVVQMQGQQAPAPLSWDHSAQLAQLRGHLHAQMQTIYALAYQAAYVFPAEEWLVPAPLPGPSVPEGDGGEAHSPS